MRADELLDDVESAYEGEEAMALLVLAVDEINSEMTGDAITMGDKERIRRAVARLRGVAHNVAEKSGANGFSISAGFPAGVSVSIDWPV